MLSHFLLGINFDHVEFQNRAMYPGYDPYDAYDNQTQRGRDCHGHGTHVASLAAGEKYGTANKANLYSVRVLGCYGYAPWSVVIDGINYAVRQIKTRRRPAIISMSLGGLATDSVDDAVRNAHSMGVIVVVSAGNNQYNACLRSPARSSHAITVGGTARGDGLYTSSNGGNCVDIFAPGQDINGADYLCNTCNKSLSGTSMATPFVSGVAAILLQRQPNLTPNQVKDKLIRDSLKDVINFTLFSRSLQRSSPNRLLHIRCPIGE